MTAEQKTTVWDRLKGMAGFAERQEGLQGALAASAAAQRASAAERLQLGLAGELLERRTLYSDDLEVFFREHGQAQRPLVETSTAANAADRNT